MMSRAETEFNKDLLLGTRRLKKEIGYNPTRFNQMVADYGGVGAVRRLLSGSDASDGFTTLWEDHRLEMSVEAQVLLPWYEELFTEEERPGARRRLGQYDFDVDAFLADAASRVPPWVLPAAWPQSR